MTREELEMRTLVRESDVIDRTDGSELAKAFNYLWEKYVEQEPCDDAISRQAVLDIAKSSKSNWIDNSILFKKVNELPPVTPQPKTGRWIPVSEKIPIKDYTDLRVWQQKVLITGYLSFDKEKELFVTEAFAEDVIFNRVHDTVVIAWMPLPKPYEPRKARDKA